MKFRRTLIHRAASQTPWVWGEEEEEEEDLGGGREREAKLSSNAACWENEGEERSQ